MLIVCKICQKPFEWHRKPGQRGGRVPIVCLSAECRKLRDHLCYLKWKKNHPYTRYEQNKKKILCDVCPTWFVPKTWNHKYCSVACQKIGISRAYRKWAKKNPQRLKEFQQKHNEEYKISGKKSKSENVAYRNVPPPKVKRYCVYLVNGKKCGAVTGNNGANYLYCDYHLAKLSNECSGEYPNNVYDAESNMADVGVIKDGNRYNNQ